MDIAKHFRKLGIDDRDVEKILSYAAGGGARRFAKNVVEFMTAEMSPRLYARVRFKEGRIACIETGPVFTSPKKLEELFLRARNEAIDDHGSLILVRVLFSSLQLRGSFSWGDRFRIRPCADTVRIGKGLNWFNHEIPGLNQEVHKGPPFPFLLEVRIPRSPNPSLEAGRSLRLLDQYQVLLTLLLWSTLGKIHHSSTPDWALIRSGEVVVNHLVYAGFDHAEDGRFDNFPPYQGPQAPVYAEDDYYGRLWFPNNELHIPKSIDVHLSMFRDLDQPTAQAFLRACYWHALGVQFSAEPSIATVSFSTAIECLLPRPSQQKCPTCDKSTGAGPTQLFKRHLKRYGTIISELEKQRDSLYDVRSELVHGTSASRVDVDFMSAQETDRDRLLLMAIVARRSILNWLSDPARPSPLPAGKE